MTTITLSGGVYTLDLQGQVVCHTWTGGNSETGDRDCSSTYWSGQARLSIESSDIVFNFETRGHREISSDKIGSLEKEFMVISNISENATISKKEEVITNFCEKLWQKVWKEFDKQETKNKLFFITTTPPIIDGKPLIDQGFIIEPGYQMEILTN